MVNRKIYVKAAEFIATNETRGCCDAINISTDDFLDASAADFEFAKMFQPENAGWLSYWWGFPMTEESQLARSLALLFMAEMTQEETENT